MIYKLPKWDTLQTNVDGAVASCKETSLQAHKKIKQKKNDGEDRSQTIQFEKENSISVTGKLYLFGAVSKNLNNGNVLILLQSDNIATLTYTNKVKSKSSKQ